MPDILTVDYETYFDPSTGYTLSKMTTEEYVRDPRFQVIMVGVKVNDQPPTWFSGDHDATREFLGDMGYERAYVLHHNANFDGAISSWVLGLRPKLFLDTLSMARPVLGMRTRLGLKSLAEWFGIGTKGDDTNWAKGLRREHFSPAQLTEYAGYCATREDSDCNITKRLFDKLLPMTTKDELLVIDSTIRMFTEPGLYLDRGVLEQHLAATRKAKAELLSRIDADDVQKTLRSAPKLAALLESFGVTPPTKVSPTTGKQAYAFAKNDKAFTELLDHPDIRVQAVVAARLGTQSTQEEKRTERLIGIASRGMFPVPIAYAGAVTTLRDSGTGGAINVQNFGRTSPIRRAIVAGPGEVIVAGDLSQIELRVNHTLAGNIDKIRLFALGEDVYVVSARETYHTDVMDITDEMMDQAADNPELLAEYKRHKLMRFVGKVKELQLGYQSGWAKYKDTVRLWSGGKVILADEEAQQHVKQWRSVNRLVVANNWRKCQKAIEAMAKGDPAVYHIGGDSEYAPVRPIETYRDGEECGFLLPSGHKIRYYDLRYDDDLEQHTYYTYKGRRSLYGGKAVENCIGEGTLVLTDSGWKAIELVADDDLVSDGVSFVAHGGKVLQGVQTCVTVDGVFMTPDHKVLTATGWVDASQVQEPYRPDLRHAHGAVPEPQQWKKVVMDIPMRVWEYVRQERLRRNKGGKARRYAELRVRDGQPYASSARYAWDVATSSVRRMAQHARAVFAAVAPGVEKLRRARNIGVPRMGGLIRYVLARHGADLQAWAYPGSHQQRRKLHAGELPMDHTCSTGAQQEEHNRRGGCGGIKRAHRDRSYYDIQPDQKWVAGGRADATAELHKPVYDILNCGPRRRFVVLGHEGPFIVHNCVQSLSRHVFMHCANQFRLHLTQQFPRWRPHPAMRVHDELVAVGPEDQAEQVAALLKACMSSPLGNPPWWPALPLASKVSWGKSYADAK